MKNKPPQCWVRLPGAFDEENRKTVVAWVHLGSGKTLLIRADGGHYVTYGWETYGFNTRPAELNAEFGIMRVA